MLPGIAVGAGGLLVAAGVATGVEADGKDCAEVEELLLVPLGKLLAADDAAAGTMLGACAGPTCSTDQSTKYHTARCLPCQLLSLSLQQDAACTFSEQCNPMFCVLHEHHIGCMTTVQHGHLQSITHLVLDLASALQPIQALQMEQS